MEYKAVKNPNRPGRPPSGCVWVKDAEGNPVTNKKGEFGYRPATADDLKKKTAGAKKKRGPKKGAGRKAAPELGEELKPALLLKKTYKSLSSAELEKIQGIVTGLIEAAKEAEKSAIEKEIAKLQGQLKGL